ncbi:MAG TPA: Uma2 family endonuclease [Bryobacteraceae bacterium]|jgi:Uma2 family endonuclease|nr:Uma2 family endonuclease [Bryobacteraceae bacterium]
MAVRATMTAEEFDALPEEEGRKWELLDGELIEVSSATPKHNRIVGRLFKLLDTFAESRRLGAALLETDLAVRANTRLRPDMGFFSAETWETVDLDLVPVVQTPDIAVEVISPSETATTINRKVDAYLKWGVQEVWLIEPEIRTLFVHTLAGAQRLSEGAMLTSEFVPGWRLQISELFENL